MLGFPQQTHSQLKRHRPALGLVVFAVVALISVLASAMTSTVALSKSIQNAHFLNDLAQNTSKAQQNQVNIDDKIETKLNALEVTVITIADELAALKFKQWPHCHAGYKYVCVTAAKV